MTVIEHEGTGPFIQKEVRILRQDHELRLEDLGNVKYSFEGSTMYVEFDPIYVDNFECLFKINFIILKSLYKPKLNGFYENYMGFKLHEVTISDELSKYLTRKLVEHFEVEKEANSSQEAKVTS